MNSKFRYVLIPAGVFVLCLCLIGGFLYLRGKDANEEPSVPMSESLSDTFTFFGIGPGTKLTKELQAQLENLLDDGGVETRTTIDLTLPGIDRFAAHFPDLQSLHDSLNYLPRQRVEHDTRQLTYRYARKKNVPFDRIRLVFSGARETPLFFSLYSKRDGADFIETIRKKYGPPETIGHENDPEHALYWRKKNAVLIISIMKNRIGFNEYHFGIYYLDSLAALADAEKKEREAAEREKEKTGELAF